MKKLIIALVGCMILSGGCNEDVLNLSNPSQFDEGSYYKTLKECQEAIAACYSNLSAQGFYSRDWYFLFDLLSGQAVGTAQLEGDLGLFDVFSYTPENKYFGLTWLGFYRMSMRALITIEKVTAWEALGAAEELAKERIIGEAHFFHAWSYFFLTELWGDVPYHESWESDRNEPAKERTPYAEVQTKIEEALKTAISMLPETWAPTSGTNTNLGRVTKDAARAMLGRLYLTQGKNDDAIQMFESIQASTYHDDYYKLFARGNHTSKEIIFQVIHKFWSGNAYYMWSNVETSRGRNCGRHTEYGFKDWNNVSIRNEAVEKFRYTLNGAEYLDPRNQSIIYGDGEMGDDDYIGGAVNYLPFIPGNSPTGYKWKKYCQYEDFPSMIIDDGNYSSILIRVADVKLLLAEAYIGKGDYNKAKALINEVRTRTAVNADPYDVVDAGNAFEILKRERFIELFGEQHYWFDLIRWDRLGKVNMVDELKSLGKTAVTDKHKKFPIPTGEKDTNPHMQLPGAVKDGWN